MKPSLQLKTSQGLAMTQQLQQAIFLLQLSSAELRAEIQEKLESNVMLEIEEDENEQNIKNLNENEQSEIEMTTNKQTEDVSVDVGGDENFQNSLTSKKTNLENQSTVFEFEEEDASYKTLHEHLRWQLNLIPISDNDKVIAETIIDSLNDDGFLDGTLENILETIDNELEETGLEEIEAVLKIIQSFEPLGVGARDLKECLLIQLKQFDQKNQKNQKAKELINDYFNLLATHDYKRLMKKLKLTEEELEEIIDFIQTMNPRPGSQVNNTRIEYTVPDVSVTKNNNKWVVKINKDTTPNLRINTVYKKMIKRADSSIENQTLKSHLQEADWFIKSLEHRSETLLNVSKCIVEHQSDFLEHGEEAMKPLILQDIANSLGLHESTISRATTRKYIHTPRGTYELKYFFASHIGTQQGGTRSSTAIRALIKKLVDNELPNKPLSDNKIADSLKKEGINIARRTIAKYRESMAIPPSNERKRMPK